MATYVIADIHGHYDSFHEMLKEIGFSAEDKLILAGDYIDRGPKNIEMLQWLENRPENVVAICGNHDVEFALYVRLLCKIDSDEDLDTDYNSPEDLKALYDTALYMAEDIHAPEGYATFDFYGTIGKMLDAAPLTLSDLCRWADMLLGLPYYYKTVSMERRCVVVHAGYGDNIDPASIGFNSLEEFYLYARREAIAYGGVKHGMIVAGHTPTIAEREFCFNDGHIYCYENTLINCKYYFIDCGCAYRSFDEKAALACLRLDDRAEFYV